MFKSFFLKYDFDSFRALVTPASGVSKKNQFSCSISIAQFSKLFSPPLEVTGSS